MTKSMSMHRIKKDIKLTHKYVKRGSASPLTKQVWRKTTATSHGTPTRWGKSKRQLTPDVRPWSLMLSRGGWVNWYKYSGKLFTRASKVIPLQIMPWGERGRFVLWTANKLRMPGPGLSALPGFLPWGSRADCPNPLPSGRWFLQQLHRGLAP